jgi:hypothetical protein
MRVPHNDANFGIGTLALGLVRCNFTTESGGIVGRSGTIFVGLNPPACLRFPPLEILPQCRPKTVCPRLFALAIGRPSTTRAAIFVRHTATDRARRRGGQGRRQGREWLDIGPLIGYSLATSAMLP